MKKTFIEETIAIVTKSAQEHSKVYDRLEAMGFIHDIAFPNKKRTIQEWELFPIFQVIPATKNFVRFIKNGGYEQYVSSIMTADQFLAEYGPVQEAPFNPPNFVVDTGNNETLSQIIQELVFAAGISWINNSKTVTDKKSRWLYVIRCKSQFPFEICGMMHSNDEKPTSIADTWPRYSAATQMGEIVRLLASPVIPPPPTPPEIIDEHKAVYTAGASIVDFGRAQISKALLIDAAKLVGYVVESDGSVMKNAGAVRLDGSNCGVMTITLSCGIMLNRDDIKSILNYMAAVDKYAKDYPSTSNINTVK